MSKRNTEEYITLSVPIAKKKKKKKKKPTKQKQEKKKKKKKKTINKKKKKKKKKKKNTVNTITRKIKFIDSVKFFSNSLLSLADNLPS